MPEKDFYQISLKTILKNDRDEILILEANNEGRFAGFYDLPGGRIDDNEFTTPFTEIIMRELKEEIGDIEVIIDPKPVALGRHLGMPALNSKKDIPVLYIFFEAKFISGEIKISEEHIGHEWINLKECEPEKLFKSGILEGINTYCHSRPDRESQE